MNPILPPKFDPFIISENQFSDLKIQFDPIFREEGEGFYCIGEKEHIVSHPLLPDWIFKSERRDFPTLPDSHIYRIRRAAKLQKIIEEKGLTTIVIHQKLLYQYQNEWLVAAKRVTLNQEITLGQPYRYENLTHVDLTPLQAREIATLCFKGRLEDVNASNIHFTLDGKVALVDTEPVSRAHFKRLHVWMRKFPLLKTTIKFCLALENSEKIYLLSTELAQKEARHLQSRALWNHLAKQVTMLAFPLITALGALHLASNPGIYTFAAITTGAAVLHAIPHVLLIALALFRYKFVRSLAGHYQMG